MTHIYNVWSFIAVPKISVVETTSNDITNDTICSHHGSRLPIGFLWRLWFSLAVCLLYWCSCYSILHPVLRILRQKLPLKKEVQEGKKMNSNSELFDFSFDGISAAKLLQVQFWNNLVYYFVLEMNNDCCIVHLIYQINSILWFSDLIFFFNFF